MLINLSVNVFRNGVSDILLNYAIREFNILNNRVDNRILIKSSDNISVRVLVFKSSTERVENIQIIITSAKESYNVIPNQVRLLV